MCRRDTGEDDQAKRLVAAWVRGRISISTCEILYLRAEMKTWEAATLSWSYGTGRRRSNSTSRCTYNEDRDFASSEEMEVYKYKHKYIYTT